MNRCFFSICLVALELPAIAEIVEPRGRDSTSIAAVIQQAQPGDTIRLSKGTYELTEPIQLVSQRKLIGAGQDETRLVYTGDKPRGMAVVIWVIA